MHSKAWPFEEARKLVARYEKAAPAKGHVLFETGYGPSGLPHIGTFGEVARTQMVRHAFSVLSDLPTRLVCFSDDMDGLRKVPDNIPNAEKMAAHLGKPLTQVPDPFGTHDSFGAHNNARLKGFLDRFGFEYEFLSATDCYKSGRFDGTLRRILKHYDAVMAVILPTLGPERRASYSPFLPICPKTGVVLQVPMVARDETAGTVSYIDPQDGERMTVPVTGGHCKLQWKADWAMRWVALDVDYEMAGKDLIDSVHLSSRIAKVLGARPPEGFNYELFLDERGEKISKSRGNGLTIEEWLRYASPESLSLYMFQAPRKAKRLFFDVIPRAVDDYYQHLAAYARQTPEQRLANPVYHIHAGAPPAHVPPVSFALLLNLVGAAHSNDKTVLWGFIARYVPGASPQSEPALDRLIDYAIAYYEDFVAPTRVFRAADARERAAMADLAARLRGLDADADAEALQYEVYEAGKAAGFDNLRDWFRALYECLLGQSQGPRMGGFIALYGRDNFIALIERVLAGEDLA
ncbi:MAG: lysine--tRNA ligase [Alphaproteobacteria bacterium]|nr:MAG: lysine--tRNA ligase [Alphaproteobacteria bacterium]